MAALGNESIQKTAIRLDPYAILANGDPSQLLPSSKRLLLHQLIETSEQDPLFRRGDIWRTFSATGFFTSDIANELKPLLSETDEQGHLQGLILELLAGSSAVPHLTDEFQTLLLSNGSSFHTRSLAAACLLEINGRDHTADVEQLVAEASEGSLSIAVDIMGEIGAESFGLPFIAEYLRVCSSLYPPHESRERTIGKRYFVEKFISALEFPTVEWILDELTRDLSCVCGESSYSCECRNGVSKIVGMLLDRYFDLSADPHEPQRIWQWVRNLNFHESKKNNSSVLRLQENDELRQGIIQLAFENKTNRDEIHDLYFDVFYWGTHAHSGLVFKEKDIYFIINLAFDNDNVSLWSYFIESHRYYHNVEQRGSNELRRYMREQARERPAFMREWIARNRSMRATWYQDRKRSARYSGRRKRWKRKQAKAHSRNIQYVIKNRELVEGGRHWSCLKRFAWLILEEPDKIEAEFGDVSLVKNALRNCFDFIGDDSLNLQNLAELQCNSKHLELEIVLAAACLETFRATGSLGTIKPHMLAAFRTSASTHYRAVENDELDALMAEADRLLFPTIKDAEKFVRAYIEPQLNIENCRHPQVSWLTYQEAFKPLQSKLSIEWLQRFPNITLHAQSELFEMAVQHGDRKKLTEIIKQRCTELMTSRPSQHGNSELKKTRTFWLVRAFYFLGEVPASHWGYLTQDKNTLLAFYERSGRLSRSDYKHWPSLSAQKIEAILLAFSEKWPRVELPDSWGTESPISEQAYRFLSEIIWQIGDDSSQNALPVLERLINDNRFSSFEADLRSIRATTIRSQALRNFEAPSPQGIVKLLDNNEVATVEGLRALLIQEFEEYQADLNGSETTSKDIFYEKGERLGEVPATLRIADRIRLRLEGKSITLTPEHQLKDANRSDFTCSKVIGNQRCLLVTEVKGQWHKDLYTAASRQLYDRYSIHPDAEQQGVYLVLWFGADEKVANKKNTEIKTADELKQSIEDTMPSELWGQIDVFVLDLSREAQ